MMRRPQHIDAKAFEMRLGGVQLLKAAQPQRNMLHPDRRVGVPPHLRLFRQLEKGQHIAIPRIEENVHVRIIRTGRGHMILGNRELEIHAQRLLVELHRLLRILAAIGDVVNAFEFGGRHQTFSSVFRTPRWI